MYAMQDTHDKTIASRRMKKLLMVFCLLWPWPLRRRMLSLFFGYKIHPTAKIGFAWVLPDELIMGPQSKIGHFTIVKGLKILELGERSSIGRGNWITGFPANSDAFFKENKDRCPALIVGADSAITSRHLLDCTDQIRIGRFSILGGFGSQLLSHSIDFKNNRQSCAPIEIGNYCFVGTRSVILGGSVLPDCSILGASSLLRQRFDKQYALYSGVPAQLVKDIDADYGYFSREIGFVS